MSRLYNQAMHDRLLIVIVVVDLLGLIAGIWMLWGRRHWRAAPFFADIARLVGLGGALSVFSAVGAILVIPSHTAFAILRLECHVIFCVLAPLMLLRGLTRWRTVSGMIMVLVALSMEATYVWARHVEPYRLQIGEHTLAIKHGTDPIRIVVVADFQADHVGDYEHEVFAQIAEAAPDLLLFPGDLLQAPTVEAFETERRALVALLRTLPSPRLGAFMVGGDVDNASFSLAEAGVRRIDDQTIRLTPRLRLMGLGLRQSSQPWSRGELAAARDFDGLTIAMGHRPDFAASILNHEVSILAVAGHTHGGQIVIPFFGPPLTLTDLPRDYAAGFHQLGPNGALAVSRSVGMERGHAPRIRLFCPPELMIIDLKPQSLEAR